MGKTKKAKFYAVAAGRAPGIYPTWSECERQVKGFRGAKFKSFATRDEAAAFVGGSAVSKKHGATAVAGGPAARSGGGDGDGTKAKAASCNQKRAVSASSAAASSAKRPRIAVSSSTNDGGGAAVITVYFDGGARGNPGVAGAGAVITGHINGEGTWRVVKIRQYCGPNATNNVAEYTGLLVGLRAAKELAEEYVPTIQETIKTAGDGKATVSLTTTKSSATTIDIQVNIRGDSDLIIKQMNGQYQCKNAGLKPLFEECRSIASQLKMMEHSTSSHDEPGSGMKCRVSIDMSHVYRNDNKVADGLANEAMDERRSWRTKFVRYVSGYEEEVEDESGENDKKKAAGGGCAEV